MDAHSLPAIRRLRHRRDVGRVDGDAEGRDGLGTRRRAVPEEELVRQKPLGRQTSTSFRYFLLLFVYLFFFLTFLRFCFILACILDAHILLFPLSLYD